MKSIVCEKCLKHLGDIEKANIKKSIVCICKECYDKFIDDNTKKLNELLASTGLKL